MSRLTGGSSGEPVRGGHVPFFYPEVKAFEPIGKNTYGIRLLPSFQFDESGNPTDLMSMVPYRDLEQVDPQSGKEKFSSWYFSLKGYKFMGNEKRQFLSPLTLYRTDKRGIDPLFDCYLTARTSKDQHSDWYQLTEKPKNDPRQRNAVLENFRVFGAMNVIQDLGQQKFENRIMTITTAGLTDLKDQLDRLTPWGEQPLDPEWPKYLLGDVTSPLHGLWAIVKEGVFNIAGMKCCLLNFSQAKDRLVGHSKWPIDVNSDWGRSFIQKRYNIADTDKVTRVPKGEEVLDFLVNDGFLPQELIHAACSDHWPVPAGHVNRRFSPPPMQSTGAPPTPTGTMTGAPSAPGGDGDLGPVTDTRQFWVVINGQTLPKPVSIAQLKGMLLVQRMDLVVMLVGDPAGWKQASAFGLWAASTPPTPSAPPTRPTPSAPPTPPTPPTPPVPPTGPGGPVRSVAPPAPAYGGPSSSPAFAPPAPDRSVSAPPPAPVASVAPGGPMVAPAGNHPASPLQQKAPPVPPVAPPALSAAVPVAPTAPAAQAVAMTPAEATELMELEKQWEALAHGQGEMDPKAMNRYAQLSDRYQAMKQSGVAQN